MYAFFVFNDDRVFVAKINKSSDIVENAEIGRIYIQQNEHFFSLNSHAICFYGITNLN